jgi:hypothetical protein
MKKIILIVFLVIIGLQFIPVDKSNPPVTGKVEASADVLAVLQRACYDCHSNETVWPWYSAIAPVKWPISRHVKVGRLHLNFSEWTQYEPEKQRHLADEIWEEIEHNGMPLKSYVMAHKDAELTMADKEIIKKWSQSINADEENNENSAQ